MHVSFQGNKKGLNEALSLGLVLLLTQDRFSYRQYKQESACICVKRNQLKCLKK